MPRFARAGAGRRKVSQFTCFEALGSRLRTKPDRRRGFATANNWTGNSNFRPLPARMWQRDGGEPGGSVRELFPVFGPWGEERLRAGRQPG
jgi:predicted permease